MSDYLSRLVARSLQVPSAFRAQAVSISVPGIANHDAIFQSGEAPELRDGDLLPLSDPPDSMAGSREFSAELRAHQREMGPVAAASGNAPLLSGRREAKHPGLSRIKSPGQTVSNELIPERTARMMIDKIEEVGGARRSRPQEAENLTLATQATESGKRDSSTLSLASLVPAAKISSKSPSSPWSKKVGAARDNLQQSPMVHAGIVNGVKPRRASDTGNGTELAPDTASQTSTLFPETTAVPKLRPKSLPYVQILPASNVIPPSGFPSPSRHDQKAERPSINVTIGRVEVRAMPAPAAPLNNIRGAPAVMNLDEYLRRRAQGDRR